MLVPGGQACCGALHVHSGERARPATWRGATSTPSSRSSPDVIIINAAGCGSTLKEYGELLADDPTYAERAERFAAQVRDVNEFLARSRLRPRAAPSAPA